MDTTTRPTHAYTSELRACGGPLSWLQAASGTLFILSGGPGAGKSSIALTSWPASVVISREMQGPLVRAYAERLGGSVALALECEATLSSLAAACERALEEYRGAPVIIDSITEMIDPIEAGRLLQHFARWSGSQVIAIAQVTDKGKPRGGPQLLHNCDVQLSVARAGEHISEVRVDKNRYGPGFYTRRLRWSASGRVQTEELGPQPYYYSVEGKPGQYRLHVYGEPGTRALYTGVFQFFAERELPLPPPPLAACSMRNPLYPGGWFHPPDIDARAAFAEERGVTFFRPGET